MKKLATFNSNRELYEKVGLEFLKEKLIPAIALGLSHTGVVKNPKKLTEDEDNLVYNVAFNILVQFEGPNPVEIDGKKYFTPLFFTENATEPEAFLTSPTKVLHGELLSEALEAFR